MYYLHVDRALRETLLMDHFLSKEALYVSSVVWGGLRWHDIAGLGWLTVSESRSHPNGTTDVRHAPECQYSGGKGAEHASHHQPVGEPKLKCYSWHPQSHLLERCRNGEVSTLFLILNMPLGHENSLTVIELMNEYCNFKRTSTLTPLNLCYRLISKACYSYIRLAQASLWSGHQASVHTRQENTLSRELNYMKNELLMLLLLAQCKDVHWSISNKVST